MSWSHCSCFRFGYVAILTGWKLFSLSISWSFLLRPSLIYIRSSLIFAFSCVLIFRCYSRRKRQLVRGYHWILHFCWWDDESRPEAVDMLSFSTAIHCIVFLWFAKRDRVNLDSISDSLLARNCSCFSQNDQSLLSEFVEYKIKHIYQWLVQYYTWNIYPGQKMAPSISIH